MRQLLRSVPHDWNPIQRCTFFPFFGYVSQMFSHFRMFLFFFFPDLFHHFHDLFEVQSVSCQLDCEMKTPDPKGEFGLLFGLWPWASVSVAVTAAAAVPLFRFSTMMIRCNLGNWQSQLWGWMKNYGIPTGRWRSINITSHLDQTRLLTPQIAQVLISGLRVSAKLVLCQSRRSHR